MTDTSDVDRGWIMTKDLLNINRQMQSDLTCVAIKTIVKEEKRKMIIQQFNGLIFMVLK